MIAIINKEGDPLGICKYRVQINNTLITEFTHNRPDGLATCLRKAADAVDSAEHENKLSKLRKICEMESKLRNKLLANGEY